MDRDQARYHAGKLRALTDILLAGKPVRWVESSSGPLGEEVQRFSVRLNYRRICDPRIAVRQRIDAGDEKYGSRVEQRPKARGRGKPRMGQHRR